MDADGLGDGVGDAREDLGAKYAVQVSIYKVRKYTVANYPLSGTLDVDLHPVLTVRRL